MSNPPASLSLLTTAEEPLKKRYHLGVFGCHQVYSIKALNKVFQQPKRCLHMRISSLVFSAFFLTVMSEANAACNGGATVTTSITITTNCDGGGSTPLDIGGVGTVSVNAGVTVSNDRYSTRQGDPIHVLSTATGASLYNLGTVSTATQWGVVNYGAGTTIYNAGVISSGTRRAIVNSSGVIATLTNVGVVSGAMGGITNLASIGVLNNLQGATSSALTYSGVLPLNYSIIVQSSSNYGQLSVAGSSGSMAFNIYGNSGTALISEVNASTISVNRYLNILQGFSSLSNVTGTSGTYGSYNFSLVPNGTLANSWDLLVSFAGPSAADTQLSLQSSAQKVRGIFNAATVATNFANMNTYDCSLFDVKGLCVSTGGSYTSVNNQNSNSTSAVVVVGYKATPSIRFGGFLNKHVNSNLPAGINVSNKTPLVGVFAVWNENTDTSGIQVKVANAYQDQIVTTTRDVFGTSEVGTGSTSLNIKSYVGELSYTYVYNEITVFRPYIALRKTTIQQGSYTETGVTTPLTYAALSDRSTTALAGLKLNRALTPQTTLTASLGAEQDLDHSVDRYSGASTSIAGLTSENFNDTLHKTRLVASVGAYYAVSKTQRFSADVYYQELPFQRTGSTTAYLSYMVGF
tara:strand:- start:684 stop:2579 length:1896 start_codon:yes stop_codon:yes gene_type:complete